MKAFAQLYSALDETTRTVQKVAAMSEYFAIASPDDAAWAVYFLSGRKPRQAVPSRRLQQWVDELTAIPDWLFEECYDQVGDLAETVALLLPAEGSGSDEPLANWVENRLLRLRSMNEVAQKQAVISAWTELSVKERFVWNKLITGEFRVGVSQLLVVRALAQVSGLAADVISHRLMGDWQPTASFYCELMAVDTTDANISRPYPFFLAHPLEGEPSGLGVATNGKRNGSGTAFARR